jgi:hypothetical protein
VACRVKVRLKVKDGVFEGRALLNSGFEAVTGSGGKFEYL